MSFTSSERYIEGCGSPPVLSRLVTSPTASMVIACSPETVTWSLMNWVSGGLISSSSGFCDRRLSFWQPASATGNIQHKNRRRSIPMVVRLLCASARCRRSLCGRLSKILRKEFREKLRRGGRLKRSLQTVKSSNSITAAITYNTGHETAY